MSDQDKTDPVVLLREAADKATPGTDEAHRRFALACALHDAFYATEGSGLVGMDMWVLAAERFEQSMWFAGIVNGRADLLAEVVRLRAQVEAVTELADNYRNNCDPMTTQAKVAEFFRRALEGGSDAS